MEHQLDDAVVLQLWHADDFTGSSDDNPEPGLSEETHLAWLQEQPQLR